MNSLLTAVGYGRERSQTDCRGECKLSLFAIMSGGKRVERSYELILTRSTHIPMARTIHHPVGWRMDPRVKGQMERGQGQGLSTLFVRSCLMARSSIRIQLVWTVRGRVAGHLGAQQPSTWRDWGKMKIRTRGSFLRQGLGASIHPLPHGHG